VDLGSDDDGKPPTKATTSVAGKMTHKNSSDLLQKQQQGISKGVKQPGSSDATRPQSTPVLSADRKRPPSGVESVPRKKLHGEGGVRKQAEKEKTETSSSSWRGGSSGGGQAAGSTAHHFKQRENIDKVR